VSDTLGTLFSIRRFLAKEIRNAIHSMSDRSLITLNLMISISNSQMLRFPKWWAETMEEVRTNAEKFLSELRVMALEKVGIFA